MMRPPPPDVFAAIWFDAVMFVGLAGGVAIALGAVWLIASAPPCFRRVSMLTIVYAVASLIGLAIAVAAFALNSSTPIQVGPVPFFGGAGVFIVFLIAVLARL